MSKYIFYFFIFVGQVLYAIGIPAGTQIKNTAYLNYSVADQNYTAVSNQLIDTVDQRLDVQIICQESENLIVGIDEKKRAFSFHMVNRGNGSDNYSLVSIKSEKSDFQVDNKFIYLDNGDNVFSSLSDTLVTEVNLSADANVTLFFVSDIPHDADNLSRNGIEVHSHLGQDLLYAESKKFGEYFLVNATAIRSKSSLCTYEVSHLAIELEKSATLSSDKLYHHSTVHYQIDLDVKGKGIIRDVVISDVIPKGTEYVEGTLRLDGQSIDDNNSTNIVTVPIGTITQSKESDKPKHYITFDVKVK